jgi:galactose-1-phosphate uridylyltransferase (family 1)
MKRVVLNRKERPPMSLRRQHAGEKHGPTRTEDGVGLIRATEEKGICRVLCFDPRHDLTLATMSEPSIERIVNEWVAQQIELAARKEISYVQIFETRGAMMGCSNAHPHGQIWATERIPNQPFRELESQSEYFKKNGSLLPLDYLRMELQKTERIVAQTHIWVALNSFFLGGLRSHPRIHPKLRRLTREYRCLGGIPCEVKNLRLPHRSHFTHGFTQIS